MRIALLLAAAGLAAQPAAAQLYKCVQGGRVVYQDAPCEQGAKETTLRAPAPAAAPAEAQAPQDRPAGTPAQAPVDVESVVEVLSGFQACANDLDGYAARFNAAYQGWRLRNQASIARFNANADAQRRVRDRLEQALKDRPQDAQGLAGRAATCDADAERWFSAKAPAPQ
jgi:hypothetical protein